MWTRITDTVLAEFSDATDVEQITRILVRLLLAALLGGVLGYEREQQGKAAGIRTACWWRWARRCSCWCRSRAAWRWRT